MATNGAHDVSRFPFEPLIGAVPGGGAPRDATRSRYEAILRQANTLWKSSQTHAIQNMIVNDDLVKLRL